MKYYLGILLIIMLFVNTLNVELKGIKKTSKAKRGNIVKGRSKTKSKKQMKKAKSKKQMKKIKSYPKKKKESHNSFGSQVDLNVLIRFKFAKYGSNVLAGFVSGVLVAFYNNQYEILSKQEDSQIVVNNHINCIQKELNSIFGNEQVETTFENKFIFGGLYPMNKQLKNYFVFTHQYKMLSRKNHLTRIVRRLKEITGTFEKIKKHKLKKTNLRILFTRRYTRRNPKSVRKNSKSRSKSSKSNRQTSKSNSKNSKRSKKAIKQKLNNSKLTTKKIKKIQKKKTKKSYINFKIQLINKQIEDKRKQLLLMNKLKRILGKHYKGISEHAKFMTYGFRKVWFYSSFLTKKVLSCSITAASKYPTTQKSFLALYRKNQRVACPFNYVDVLAMMLSDYSVRHSFDTIFYKLFVQGVKNRLIHKLKWSKIGQAVFSSHQILAKLCPWF